jgi:hypothetical protein
MASCPHCGKQEPAFDGQTVTCQRCGNITQIVAASDFLKKAETLWPNACEATLRSGRVAKLIEKYDEYLKKRGDYDIIAATLDENWIDDEPLDDGDTEVRSYRAGSS